MDFRQSDPTLSAAHIAKRVLPHGLDDSRRTAFENAVIRSNIQTARASNLHNTLINKEPAAAVLALIPEFRAQLGPNSRLAALNVATTYVFGQPASDYDKSLFEFAQVNHRQTFAICRPSAATNHQKP